ncbi:MAG: NADP-dependent glyceraldehyde-3-phosphate dehydrogenase [Thermoproteota archaeon]|nr:NADP-dependent glyceraldehyde-3-phosphate dehydrogenase [Candidatus Brockarchaeota archaeon]MBO3767841.1 NADP-dependent glyceraldehyde-3-phosphate dehydrogenase [Candidatus Brockarchaeota archaeon]
MSIRRLELKNVFKEIYKESDNVYVFKTFLSGKWVSSSTLRPVYSPIDGQQIAKVPQLTWEQIDSALEETYRIGKWNIRETPGDRRLAIVNKIADLMEENKEDFIRVLIENCGKTRSQAEGEVQVSIDRMRSAEFDIRKIFGEYVPGDWSDHTLESEGIVRKEPYGVVLGIIPFNYPLFDTVNKFVYSIIAGNAFLVKPPSADPLPILLFAKLVQESGFPNKAFSVLTIPGKESDKLVSDRRVNVISFTGSTSTGLKILSIAGVKQLIMEMGGGNPAVVLSDADINLSASKIAIGITSYSGQRCDAIKLILVEKPIYEELKKKLVEELSKFKIGNPWDENTNIGPLIEPTSVDEMINAIEDAKNLGGEVIYGGKRMGSTYIEPTLIEVEDKEKMLEMKVFKEEIFAPVALITNFEKDEEAIELTNMRRYGLDAAIFGKNIERLRKYMRRLEVGAIYINDYPRHGIGYYPFGGRKDSGIGREGIGYSIEYVTALKTIVYNYRGKGIWEYV